MKKILSLFNKILHSTESTKKTDSFLIVSNSIYDNLDFEVIYEDELNPRSESFHGRKTIFLPAKYDSVGELPSIYKALIGVFGDEIFSKFVAYHEFGHALEVTLMDGYSSSADRRVHINAKPFNGKDINYLFNGASNPDTINKFLIKLFKEGFADCYAGLCLYKEHNDIEVFSKIAQVRSQRYSELKKEEGVEYLHPNFNVSAAEKLKEAITESPSKGRTSLPCRSPSPLLNIP